MSSRWSHWAKHCRPQASVTVVALRNFTPLVEEAGLSFIPVEREWMDESTQAAILKSREKSFTEAALARLGLDALAGTKASLPKMAAALVSTFLENP
jgi:hypothetical protein